MFTVQMPPPSSRGLVIMDRFFLRSLNATFPLMLGYCRFSEVGC